jgi:uncharacterized protein YaiE (UPF0345 family)
MRPGTCSTVCLSPTTRLGVFVCVVFIQEASSISIDMVVAADFERSTACGQITLCIQGTLDTAYDSYVVWRLRSCGAKIDVARGQSFGYRCTDPVLFDELAELCAVPKRVREIALSLASDSLGHPLVHTPSPRFCGSLKGYQSVALAFANAILRGMLALDMGLGKTVLGIAYLLQYLPALIITPACIRTGWLEHLALFCPSVSVFNHDGTLLSRGTDGCVLPDGQTAVFLCTYSKMAAIQTRVQTARFGCVVVDEAHYLKNETSARSRYFTQLQRSIPRTLLLTGTPAQKHADLFHLLKLLDPVAFRTFFHYRPPGTTQSTPGASLVGQKRRRTGDVQPQQRMETFFRERCPPPVPVLQDVPFFFAERYCRPEFIRLVGARTGFKFNRNQRAPELQLLCERYLLRMVKEDVVTLPPLERGSRVIDSVDTTEKEFYTTEVTRIDEIRERRGSLYADAALMELCRVTARRKIDKVCRYLTPLVTDTPTKTILFFHHREIGQRYQAWLQSLGQDHIYIDGRITQKVRAQRIAHWKTTPSCTIGLLSLCATSTGLNLQFCRRVFCLELTFLSVHHTQSEARVYRIGQDQPVSITYLLLGGSTDDMLWMCLNNKQRVEQNLFGTGTRHMTGNLRPVTAPEDEEEIVLPL